jgi:Flp pilus assembly protein TadG
VSKVQWIKNRVQGDDRGVIAVLVSILLGFGALFGIGVLVVDVGQSYVERAELQNAADAGALALAKQYAKGGVANPNAVAGYYLGGSTGGETSALPNASATPYPPGTAAPQAAATATNCPNAAADPHFVDVVTQADARSFFRALVPGDDGAVHTVRACARAKWGGIGRLKTLALTISQCEWENAVGPAGVYPVSPPNLPSARDDRVLVLHKSGDNTCTSKVSGQDYPGGFGWLPGANDDCQADINVDNIYDGDPGANMPNACSQALFDAASHTPRPGEPVFLPIYADVPSGGSGSGIVYELKGFAAFVVTGYYWSSGKSDSYYDSWLNPRGSKNAMKNYCISKAGTGGGAKCVFGYFTQDLVPNGSIGGGYFGASTASLTD